MCNNKWIEFGLGASLVSIFSQFSGGIFSKAADAGTNIAGIYLHQLNYIQIKDYQVIYNIGKIEYNIAEFDSKNPAVLSVLVGNNVGHFAI